jgi:hypothetical protein
MFCPACGIQLGGQGTNCPSCQWQQHATGIENDAAMRILLPVGRSGWAIAAGYLGLVSMIVFPAPLALIVSILAIREIRKNPSLGGMGRAIFGLVMGSLFSLIFILLILMFMISIFG